MGASDSKQGASSSKSKKAGSGSRSGPFDQGFRTISDNFRTLEQVTDALRKEGLESSQLIVAVDFTKSNEWTGRSSFMNKSLHYLGPNMNPYEEAISIIAKTMSPFDDDNLIPCYGFGDATTQDAHVFSFFPSNEPAPGMESLLLRYREMTPYVKLAGPTSFAPAIYQAMRVVVDSGNQYHILLLVADGQVTRASDLPPGQLSPQEQATVNAIVAASELPLSIVMVGVGDGPWEMMREFDDALPARKWDNFQFVNFTEIMTKYAHDRDRKETIFALNALMEIPEQYRIIQRLGLIRSKATFRTSVQPLNPPGPRPGSTATPSAPSFAASQSSSMRYNEASYPAMNAPPQQFGSARHSFVADAVPNGLGAAAVNPLYVCPITQEVMKDPVLAADGFTYEREGITTWLTSHDTSPMTNQRLPHKQLTPNHALRSSILEYMQRANMAP